MSQISQEPMFIGQELLKRGFRQWFLYLFQIVNGSPWKEENIHKKMFKQLQECINGNCTRLNFNLSPRSGKCFGKGTLIRMFDGSVKKVEDIVVGDVVMGDDETPRHVLALGHGREEMFKITHDDGTSFVCNKSHLLVLKNTTNERNMTFGRTRKSYKGIEKIISVGDYINATPNFKKRNKAYKAKCEYCEKELVLDPYMLGIWLGDGDTASSRITNMDSPIIEYIYQWALEQDNKVRVIKQKKTECNTYALSADGRDCGLRSLLRKAGVLFHKHIPQAYLTASRSQRLELLAGLIDIDGSVGGNNRVEIMSVRKELADNYAELARSLGFRASIHVKVVNNKDYYRVGISGDLSCVPVRVPRKVRLAQTTRKINVLYQSFKVEPLGIDNYYGFVIDGNHKFLLADYTVVHNTTMSIHLVVYALTVNPKAQVIYTSFNQDLLSQISQQVAAIMQHPVYQAMYPQNRTFKEEVVEVDPVNEFWKDYLIETTGKIKFSSRKIFTPQGGVVLFNSIGSAITGFGAGTRNAKGFSGVLVCFPYDEYVWTENGREKIGDIVEAKKNTRVWSFNIKTGRMELKPVVNWIKNPGDDLLEVSYMGHSFRCTPDHKVFTLNRGYVPAKNLCVDDIPACPADSFDLTHGKSGFVRDYFPAHISVHNQIKNFFGYSRLLTGKIINALRKTFKAAPASNASKVRNTISSFVSDNRSPLLVRKVGHIDKSYCITVGDNHNFVVGEKQGFIVKNCDDVDKPTDVRSETIRNKTHTYFVETLLTRLNNPNVPIINIQQRLHIDDMSGFLEKEYGFITFKAPLLDENGNCNLGNQYTPERIKELQINNYVFQAQYQQNPIPLGGSVIKHEYYRYYKDAHDQPYRRIFMTADTANKTKEWNDYTAIMVFGLTHNRRLRLLDMVHAKLEIPELQATFETLWDKWRAGIGSCRCSAIYIEDKASGTQVIQMLRRKGGLPIMPVIPEKDKLTRVLDVIPQIAAGNIELPESDRHPISAEFLAESDAFSADGSHIHDDMVDAMTMGINQAYSQKGYF